VSNTSRAAKESQGGVGILLVMAHILAH